MRFILLILNFFIAITAIIGGVMMIITPDGSTFHMALTLLSSSPFKSFLIPGIILAFIVGGINLIAVFYNVLKPKNKYTWSLAGGVVITGWIIMQMILVQVFHWLQFLYIGVGLLIILLSYQLKGKWLA